MANTQELDFTVWKNQTSSTPDSQVETPISYPSDFKDDSSGKSSTQTQDAADVLSEEPAQKTQSEHDVRLYDGVFEEGSDGFQFNKKCKVKVKVDLLNGTTDRKKVSFETFVEFDGDKEDLGQPLDGQIKETTDENQKKCHVAEAEMMLYYGEKFHQAWQKDNSVTCKYLFKATHPKAKNPVESTGLGMPYEAVEEEVITLFLEDDKGEPLKNVEVEVSTGEKLVTDENGMIEVKKAEEAEDKVEVVSVNM